MEGSFKNLNDFIEKVHAKIDPLDSYPCAGCVDAYLENWYGVHMEVVGFCYGTAAESNACSVATDVLRCSFEACALGTDAACEISSGTTGRMLVTAVLALTLALALA
jgi:hypothetical protein